MEGRIADDDKARDMCARNISERRNAAITNCIHTPVAYILAKFCKCQIEFPALTNRVKDVCSRKTRCA